MLTFGHTATGYLISQKAKLSIWWLILAANIFDLDFFIFGAGHHGNFTHTPFMGLVYLGIFYLLLKNKFKSKFFFWIGIALFSHLILDDLSYWLSFIGREKPVTQQINWLFPFSPLIDKNYSVVEALTNYLVNTPRLFYLEILLVILALITWFCVKIRSR